MNKYTYCWAFYGSTTIEANDWDEADTKFDQLDMEYLRNCEDDWGLTLIQEEDENGKTTDRIM